MLRSAIAALLVVAFSALPAEAAQLLLKDGRLVQGVLKVEANGLSITGANGKTETFSYAVVQAVSLDDEPLTPPPVEARKPDDPLLTWTLVGANLAAVLMALLLLYRTAR